jgi:hypothetical protein
MLRQSFGVSAGMWTGGSGEGRVEQVGRAHEWVHMSQLGVETRVSASDRDGHTRLILSQRVGHASPKVEGIGYGALLGLVGGVIGTAVWADALGVSGWLLFVLLTLVTTLVAAPLITRLDRGWREKKQRGLKELAVEVEQVFEDATPGGAGRTASPEATPRTAEPEPAGRIDLDAVPEAEGGGVRSEAGPRNRVRP